MKAIEIILIVLTVSMIILSIVNVHLIREQIENNLKALDLLNELLKAKHPEFYPPENRETLDRYSPVSNHSWTPEAREAESLRRLLKVDDSLIWLDDMEGLRKERY